jgi:hypothetical protein
MSQYIYLQTENNILAECVQGLLRVGTFGAFTEMEV